MYRKDYFLKLIQQFAKVLAKLMGLKEAGEFEKAKLLIDESYKEFLGLDADYIKSLPLSNLITTLSEKHQISDKQFEVLARLFYEESDLNHQTSKDFLNKALHLLEFLNTEQKLYSFEREEFIEKIRLKMKSEL